jgi:thiamine pyrophosphokinase
MPHRIIIFANGDLPEPDSARALIQPDDFILCADGGARHALTLGLTPHLIIGDFDSLAPEIARSLEDAGAEIRRFPRDKDDTDLELALRAARDLHPRQILLLGALGGRLDQMLANILLLAQPAFSNLDITIIAGRVRAKIVRDEIVVRGHPGDILSVLPLTSDVTGLSYHSGLRWPLEDAALPFGSSRGVSNELIAEKAHITLHSGVILVIHTRRQP